MRRRTPWPPFRLAWERGTDGIECDVHRTADGEVVVIHDGDTGRVAGTKLPIARSSAEKLRKLDVGSFRGRQFVGEKLPLFSELLAAMPGKGLVYIELKDREPGLAEAVAALVRRHGKGPEQVRFISFHADAVPGDEGTAAGIPRVFSRRPVVGRGEKTAEAGS